MKSILSLLHFMKKKHYMKVVFKVSGILKNPKNIKLEYQIFTFKLTRIRYHITDTLNPVFTNERNWGTEHLNGLLEISWFMLEYETKQHPMLWIPNAFQANIWSLFCSEGRANVKESHKSLPLPTHFSTAPKAVSQNCPVPFGLRNPNHVSAPSLGLGETSHSSSSLEATNQRSGF